MRLITTERLTEGLQATVGFDFGASRPSGVVRKNPPPHRHTAYIPPLSSLPGNNTPEAPTHVQDQTHSALAQAQTVEAGRLENLRWSDEKSHGWRSHGWSLSTGPLVIRVWEEIGIECMIQIRRRFGVDG
jgi:hypothetical protein